MPLSYVQVTPPSVDGSLLPVTLAEAKNHLRVDVDEEDDTITAVINAAWQYVEDYTNRALLASTWDYFPNKFPSSLDRNWNWQESHMEIPLGQLQSVTYLNYTNTAGVTQQWAPLINSTNNYDLIDSAGTVRAHIDTNGEPGRLQLAFSRIWPPDILRTANAIQIRFVAGWATPAAIPERIKQAMKLIIGHLYANKESVVLGRALVPAELPLAHKALLASQRLRVFGNG